MCARHCTAVGRTLRYFICNKYYRLLLFALICSGPHIHTDTVNSMWNIWVRVRVCVLCKVVRVLVCLKPAQFVYVCLCACACVYFHVRECVCSCDLAMGMLCMLSDQANMCLCFRSSMNGIRIPMPQPFNRLELTDGTSSSISYSFEQFAN